MDPIKDAFSKIKIDIDTLNSKFSVLREEMIQTREELIKMCQIIINLDRAISEIKEEKNQNHDKNLKISIPAQESPIQTTSTHNPTHQQPHYAPKDPNKA